MAICEICNKQTNIDLLYKVKLEKPNKIINPTFFNSLINDNFITFSVCRGCLNKFLKISLIKDEV